MAGKMNDFVVIHKQFSGDFGIIFADTFCGFQVILEQPVDQFSLFAGSFQLTGKSFQVGIGNNQGAVFWNRFDASSKIGSAQLTDHARGHTQGF